MEPSLRSRLAPALWKTGIKLSPEKYLALCKRKAAMVCGAALVASLVVILYLALTNLFILVPLIGICAYMMSYSAFSQQPMNKVDENMKAVENDILFAARDMIVSMRSGLPLFNSMATVSVGYGAASKEFERIIDRVQLGVPMEQAIEEVSSKSKSPTFKRLMLQASTSIKVGSDVVQRDTGRDKRREPGEDNRAQEVRAEAQRDSDVLHALRVIFPSMGLAVISIMSTFIKLLPGGQRHPHTGRCSAW